MLLNIPKYTGQPPLPRMNRAEVDALMQRTKRNTYCEECPGVEEAVYSKMQNAFTFKNIL